VFVVAHAVMKAWDASRQEERLHGRYQGAWKTVRL
jgi:hypothetical protein